VAPVAGIPVEASQSTPRDGALLQTNIASLNVGNIQGLAQSAAGSMQPLRSAEPPANVPASVATQASSPDATAAPQASATAEVSAPRPTSVPKVRPLFTTYTVQEGDTIQKVSVRTGIAPEYLKVNNPLITDIDRLIVGQQVRIPMANGLIHDIHSGETLHDIADRYDSTLQAILAANEITDPNSISVRAQIFIPHAKMPTPDPPSPALVPSTSQVNAPVALSVESPSATATRTPSVSQAASASSATRSSSSTSSASSSAAATATATSSTAAAAVARTGGSSCSVWPVGGAPISSAYGPGHPLGTDFDMFNRAGAPVAACAGGTVTFAGGDACCSYGLYVDIDHGNGFSTRYAHCSAISVSRGQTVGAGQKVCAAGSTGYSTGTHLHFEARRGGAIVNPMGVLP
jgi:murein DD-endopeptidase MepM/ murein hydrolase activator NlpD